MNAPMWSTGLEAQPAAALRLCRNGHHPRRPTNYLAPWDMTRNVIIGSFGKGPGLGIGYLPIVGSVLKKVTGGCC